MTHAPPLASIQRDVHKPGLADSDAVTSTSPGATAPALGTALFALAISGFGIGTTEVATGYLISLYALGEVVGAPLITGLASRCDRSTPLLGLVATLALARLAGDRPLATAGSTGAQRFGTAGEGSGR